MQSTLRLARPSAPRAFAQRLSSLPRASALLSTAATSSPARRSLASSTATTPAALLAQHHHRRAFSSSPRPRQAAGGQTMRVVQIEGGVGPSSALHIGEIARPVPKEGEVLVKVRPSGVSPPAPVASFPDTRNELTPCSIPARDLHRSGRSV